MPSTTLKEIEETDTWALPTFLGIKMQTKDNTNNENSEELWKLVHMLCPVAQNESAVGIQCCKVLQFRLGFMGWGWKDEKDLQEELGMK